jgi:uncharacterized membrane protein YtjA (UPF0391 family)
MSWALPFLFIRLIAYLHGANGFTNLMPELPWTLLVVSLALLFISVIASRHSILLLWPRFQRRAVQ